MKQASLFRIALLLFCTFPSLAEESAYPHGDFEDDCSLCHSADAWSPAVIGREFKHAKRGMALQGAHAQSECRACHLTLQFDLVDRACVSCHLDVHQGELGVDCERCHTSRSFIDRSAMVRAHVTTRFPLRGTHRSTDCEDCHALNSPGSLQFVKTPVECESCHLAEYQGTTDPDHEVGGFPQSCETCHSTLAWMPAGINHNALPASAQCVDCHLGEFQNTTNPDHQSAGFSESCEVCHGTNFWVPALFDGSNHDGLFPIFSGKHDNKWDTCNECHLVPSDFGQFSCIDCHEHDDRMDLADKHEDEPGYLYDSQACYDCHPQGEK